MRGGQAGTCPAGHGVAARSVHHRCALFVSQPRMAMRSCSTKLLCCSTMHADGVLCAMTEVAGAGLGESSECWLQQQVLACLGPRLSLMQAKID